MTNLKCSWFLTSFIRKAAHKLKNHIRYTGCIKRPGQSLWSSFRTLFVTKNPNTLFPNSSPFPSYANITRISPPWFHCHFVAEICSQLLVFRQLFRVSISSCPDQVQRLTVADVQNVPLSYEHMLQHAVSSLATHYPIRAGVSPLQLC